MRSRLINLGMLVTMSAVMSLSIWPTKAEAILIESDYFSDDLLFPTPEPVRQQVAFWEVIFQKYPSTTVLIHDSHDLTKVIDIIDFKRLKNGRKATKRQRDRMARGYLKRYRKALRNLKKHKHKAIKYGDIERRLFHAYNKSSDGLSRLLSGSVTLRAQAGLADTFIEAAKRARRYLPEMERIFASYGLPKKLTRLVFVESMFRSDAVSKVGASGMWQFMPATAKKFLYISRLVDERNSPFKATRAAAQLLSENFRELRSWPLAVTAYNHGREGMKRASRALNTQDMGEIIENYSSRTFGFASRNFYGELLAAANTYQHLLAHNPALFTIKPLDVQSVILTKPISVASLLDAASLPEKELRYLNPCITDRAFKRPSKSNLPEFFEIFVPSEIEPRLARALQHSDAKKIARR